MFVSKLLTVKSMLLEKRIIICVYQDLHVQKLDTNSKDKNKMLLVLDVLHLVVH